MGKIEGIIFDMDGTLFDTERLSFSIWKKVLKKYGYTITKEGYTSLMGRKYEDVNKILIKRYGENFPIKKIREEKDGNMIKQIQEKGAPLKHGAYELLDFLVENGYKLALATSSSIDRVDCLLEKVDIRDKFGVIICGDDVTNSKPDPEIFLKAAERIEVDPKKCIVLEDSPVGLEAAYNGGIMSINIPDLKDPDDQINRLAYKICGSLLEVKDYLLEYTST